MSLKAINEAFKRLFLKEADENKDDIALETEETVVEESNGKSVLRKALEGKWEQLKTQNVSDIKQIEVNFQDVIESLVPGKLWWEVTDCDIFWSLFNDHDPQKTIDEIVDRAKEDVVSGLSEEEVEVYDWDNDPNRFDDPESPYFNGDLEDTDFEEDTSLDKDVDESLSHKTNLSEADEPAITKTTTTTKVNNKFIVALLKLMDKAAEWESEMYFWDNGGTMVVRDGSVNQESPELQQILEQDIPTVVPSAFEKIERSADDMVELPTAKEMYAFMRAHKDDNLFAVNYGPLYCFGEGKPTFNLKRLYNITKLFDTLGEYSVHIVPNKKGAIYFNGGAISGILLPTMVIGSPKFTSEQTDIHNLDTPYERDFGEAKEKQSEAEQLSIFDGNGLGESFTVEMGNTRYNTRPTRVTCRNRGEVDRHHNAWEDMNYDLAINGADRGRYFRATDDKGNVIYDDKVNEAYETPLQVKARHQKEFNEFPLHFAFGREQIENEFKKMGLDYNNPEDLKKVRSIGAGGFIHVDDVPAFNDMLTRQERERKEARKNEKGLIDEIVYELGNHEYGYTRDITDTVEAMGYSMDEYENDPALKALFKKAIAKYRKTGAMDEAVETDNVYDWYKSKAPDDYQLDLIDKKVTFTDLAKKLKKGEDRKYYRLDSEDVGVGEYIDSAPLDDITSETIRRVELEESRRGFVRKYKGCSIHDMGDTYVVTNEHGLNIGQSRTESGCEGIIDEYIQNKQKTESKHRKLGEAPMTQKEKAIECLTKCNIYKPYIKAFEEKGIVTLFEQGMGYYIDESSEPTCYKQIQKMASEGNMVWAVTHEMTEFGELYDFLFVPKSKSEWKYSLDGSGNSFYAYAYVLNTTDEWNSEYGDIVIRPIFGGIQRVG